MILFKLNYTVVHFNQQLLLLHFLNSVQSKNSTSFVLSRVNKNACQICKQWGSWYLLCNVFCILYKILMRYRNISHPYFQSADCASRDRGWTLPGSNELRSCFLSIHFSRKSIVKFIFILLYLYSTFKKNTNDSF